MSFDERFDADLSYYPDRKSVVSEGKGGNANGGCLLPARCSHRVWFPCRENVRRPPAATGRKKNPAPTKHRVGMEVLTLRYVPNAAHRMQMLS